MLRLAAALGRAAYTTLARRAAIFCQRTGARVSVPGKHATQRDEQRGFAQWNAIVTGSCRKPWVTEGSVRIDGRMMFSAAMILAASDQDPGREDQRSAERHLERGG